jgi:hypothetical protein
LTLLNVRTPKLFDRSAALSGVAALTDDREVIFSMRAASNERQNVIEGELIKPKCPVAQIADAGVSQVNRFAVHWPNLNQTKTRSALTRMLGSSCSVFRGIATLAFCRTTCPLWRVRSRQVETRMSGAATVRAKATSLGFDCFDLIRAAANLAVFSHCISMGQPHADLIAILLLFTPEPNDPRLPAAKACDFNLPREANSPAGVTAKSSLLSFLMVAASLTTVSGGGRVHARSLA